MDMMELPPEIGKLLLGKFKELLESQDESKWVTVGTLRPEDIIRERTFKSDVAALRGKAQVLVSKIEAIEAERKVKHSEFWEHLYSTYNLPRDGHYTIGKDHAIKKKPTKGQVCICGNCKDDD